MSWSQPQSKFDSRFALGNVLGKGGYGTVSTAVDRITSERFAVKSILKDRLHGADYREKMRIRKKEEQIEKEIHFLRLLDHPNVIKFYALFDEEDYFLICMELCEGGDLFDKIIKSKTQFTENDVRNLMINILSALEHCHSRGIVHRDIKPENIMLTSLTSLSDIKLIDFGLAIEEVQIFPGNGVCGTVGFMAPEMYSNRKYNRAVDMWSLGVFMFILHFGYFPISPATASGRTNTAALSNGFFQFPQNSSVSDELRDFIAKLMCKDVRSRLTVESALRHGWVCRHLFTMVDA
jgi:calcium-dependent protein kinase